MKHGLLKRTSGLAVVVALVGIVGSISGGGEPAGAAPAVQATFQGLTPARLLETRPLPNNTTDGDFHPSAKAGPDSTTDVTVVGRGGVPATGVGAVALNVTVAEPETTSYITVYPKGVARPNASNLNMVAGQTVANSVIVPVGADGQVSLYNESGSTQLIVDVLGWFPSGPAVTALTPARLLETRALPNNTTDGEFHPSAKVGPDSTTDVTVLGRGGVPASGVEAVAVNVTVAEPEATSYVTVFPKGAGRPNASNLNMAAGKTVPNLVIVPVGADGQISLYNESGNTHLIVDVVAYFPSGDGIEGLTPARLLETRDDPNNTADGLFHPKVKIGADSTTDVTVVGRGGVPATGVGAVALNVTVAEPEATSYVTVFPKGVTRPNASNLNMVAGLTVANSVIVPVGADGQVSFYNESGNTHLIVDVTAWFPTAVVDVPDSTTTTSTTTTIPAPPQPQTRRVNLSSAQAESLPPDAESPAISADGRYVVFTSPATNLVAGDPAGVRDVFRRDLTTGVTVKVSTRLACSGTGDPDCASGDALEPSISRDGRYVAFFSGAEDLAASSLVGGVDNNNLDDIFRKDLQTGTIIRVSLSTAGAQTAPWDYDAAPPGPGGSDVTGLGESTWPSISGDGTKIAFVSEADNLVGAGADTNQHKDVFVRTITNAATGAGTTERVSVSSSEVEGTGGSVPFGGAVDANFSDDGNFVVFTSDDNTLDPTAVDAIRQVYRRNLVAGTTALVSKNATGGQGGDDGTGGGSFDPSLSSDGRYVMFHSSAGDLLPGGDPTPGTSGPPVPGPEDVYWRDMSDGNPATANKLVAANSSEPPPDDPLGANVQMSADGRYVAFTSASSTLVAGDGNGVRDVFRRDMTTSDVVRVSVGTGNVQANAASNDPSISADGKRVVFLSAASNLVTASSQGGADGNGAVDVFVYDFV